MRPWVAILQSRTLLHARLILWVPQRRAQKSIHAQVKTLARVEVRPRAPRTYVWTRPSLTNRKTARDPDVPPSAYRCDAAVRVIRGRELVSEITQPIAPVVAWTLEQWVRYGGGVLKRSKQRLVAYHIPTKILGLHEVALRHRRVGRKARRKRRISGSHGAGRRVGKCHIIHAVLNDSWRGNTLHKTHG